jgi:hypothetical protein
MAKDLCYDRSTVEETERDVARVTETRAARGHGS